MCSGAFRQERSGHERRRRPPGARHARLRRRHRPRGARHPARAARGRLRLGDLRRDGGPAARGSRPTTTAIWSTRAVRTTCCSTISRSDRARHESPSRCPIGWRSSTTTSRRRSTSWACTTSWWSCAGRDAASWAPTSTGATWHSAIRSSTARSSRGSASRARASFRSSPTSPISTPRPTSTSPARSTTSGRTCCSWAA